VSKRAPHHSARTLKAIAAATLTGAAIFASSLGTATAAAAAGECTAVASPQGSPSAPGTLAAPVRTAQQAIDIAGAGGVACLRAGSYSSEDQIRLEQPGTTLMSYPGERAALRGRVYVTKTGDGVTVANLDIDGRNENTQPSPTINGDDVTISGNDITNYNTGICIVVGSPDPQWGRAHDTLIEDNRIHDCGVLPAENFDHGIYVSAADRTVIRNNWIYDNADRGIQLYSDADNTTITGNVIDGNGQGVIFGGHEESSSDHNTVTNNVITNSKIRDNIESSFAPGQIGTGNIATDNCVGGGAYDEGDGGILAGPVAQVGFRAENNLIGDPGYANRAAKDFSLDPQSPCGRILAGAPAPEGGGKVESPKTEKRGRLTIKIARDEVRKHARFKVRGKVAGGNRVKILQRRNGNWHRVSGASARAGGAYKARIRVRGTGREVIKAVAPGVGSSKPVAIKVKR
jgi:parallel beta-helix repeat protein